ncbi:Sigma-54-dependent Fis family transcriptional regulator [Gammaproteobacteria bacterium]
MPALPLYCRVVLIVTNAILLIIEDEPLFGDELVRHFRRNGWDVRLVRSIAEARDALVTQCKEPLVVLSDMSLPDGNALDLLEEARNRSPIGEWVFLTGYGGIADSVRALRLGAYDFLEKPCDPARLDLVVTGAARSAHIQLRLQDQVAEQNRIFSPEAFLGRSSITVALRDMLARLAQVPFSALLLSGETGTGKGMAARILHHNGRYSQGPMVEVNCAALPRELIESELFGAEPGAFTGARSRRRGLVEQAHGGTLFLDEIGELNLDMQAKLLKVIEDRRFRRLGGTEEVTVDVRIITATNRNLAEWVKKDNFRGDLFHRISVFRLEMPPLRERLDDLQDLVPLFVTEFNAKAGKRVKIISDAVWARMLAYPWPGNVRELRNVVERCVLLSEDKIFPAQWLQLQTSGITSPLAKTEDPNCLWLPLDGSVSLDDMESYIIRNALQRTNCNVAATARLLGVTRQTLRYRIQKYNLKCEDCP